MTFGGDRSLTGNNHYRYHHRSPLFPVIPPPPHHHRYYHYSCITVSLFLLLFHGTALLFCVHRLDLFVGQQQQHLHHSVLNGTHSSSSSSSNYVLLQRREGGTLVEDRLVRMREAIQKTEKQQHHLRDDRVHNNNNNPLRNMIRNRNPNHPDNREFLLSRCNHHPSWPLLIHLHIGKAGGTSFHKTVTHIARTKGYCVPGSPNTHFDWSWIIEQQQLLREEEEEPPPPLLKSHPRTKMDVVMMIRDPVARAVSHFYYLKKQEWTADIPRFRNQTIAEFLQDPETMIRLRDIWQDGQAGISWLTGTHIASFVSPHLSKQQIRQNDQALVVHPHEMMSLAADRLERDVKFFGILEDIPRSMQLLRYEFSLQQVPVMEHRNQNRKRPRNETVSPWVIKTLQSLMPQDMWLYQHAKQLFEARWKNATTIAAMQTTKNIELSHSSNGTFSPPPPRPPFPTALPCTSLRRHIQCIAGPLAGLNYTLLFQ
jgi:hypothetical protein